jgi:hypothetical protein
LAVGDTATRIELSAGSLACVAVNGLCFDAHASEVMEIVYGIHVELIDLPARHTRHGAGRGTSSHAVHEVLVPGRLEGADNGSRSRCQCQKIIVVVFHLAEV